MLKIGSAYKDSVKRNLIRSLADRFGDEHPDRNITQLVEDGIVNGEKLEIVSEEDLLRFISLNFLPVEIRNSNFFLSVIYLILINKELPSEQRLDLVEDQVCRRCNFSLTHA